MLDSSLDSVAATSSPSIARPRGSSLRRLFLLGAVVAFVAAIATLGLSILAPGHSAAASDAEIRVYALHDDNNDGSWSYAQSRLPDVKFEVYLNGSTSADGSATTAATGVQPASVYDVLATGPEDTSFIICGTPPDRYSFVSHNANTVADPEGQGRDCGGGTVSSSHVGVGGVGARFLFVEDAEIQVYALHDDNNDGSWLYAQPRLPDVKFEVYLNGSTSPDGSATTTATGVQPASVYDVLATGPEDTSLIICGTPPDGYSFVSHNANSFSDPEGQGRDCGGGTVSSSHVGVGAASVTFLFVGTCAGEIVTIDMNLNGGVGMGTPNDDVILGTPGADVINALGGNDTVCSGAGHDEVYGGGGNDTIYASWGADRVFGEDGDDTIYGEHNADYLVGGQGTDTIDGGEKSDRIYGDDFLGGPLGGDDILHGGVSGSDLIYGGAGNDMIDGGIGNDRLFGQQGVDTIEGGNGDDKIYGGTGSDILSGGNDRDKIWGETGNDTISGNAGDDFFLDGDEHNDKVYGGGGNDIVRGGDGRDKVYGQGGDDDVRAQAGDDWVTDGGPGIDSCQVAPEDTPGGDIAAINCE